MDFRLKKADLLKGMLSGAAVAAMTATGALAQSDQIIVTATKRPQTLQEVPVAVSVVDADVIEKAQVIDLIDLQTVVPSLRVTQLQNSSQTNFLIRGFGNGANNPGIEGSVGVFIDGVFRSRSASAILDLPTLERVEVLRGPQSTLFGKNVSAGAISITTKAPEYDWGGSVEATYGNFNQVLFRGTLTGPLSDSLAFRVSGSINERNGYYTNIVDGSEVNERSRWSSRAQLLWEPTDAVSFRLIGEYNKIDEVCCGAVQLFNGPATLGIGPGTIYDFANATTLAATGAPMSVINGIPVYSAAQIAAGTIQLPLAGLGGQIGDASDPFAREVAYDLNPSNELTGKGLSLQGNWDLESAQVTGIISYREQDDNTETDADFSSIDALRNPQSRSYETFTAELRLASTGDNFVDWLVGGFYFDENVDFQRDVIWGADARAFANNLTALGAGSPLALAGFETMLGLDVGTFFAPGSGVFGDYQMDNRSFSFFGQFDVNLTDRLTVTGGVSYINDRKESIGNSILSPGDIGNVDLNGIGLRGYILGATGGMVDIATADPAVVAATLATPLPDVSAGLPAGAFAIDPNTGAVLTGATTLGALGTAISQTSCFAPSPALACNSALALAPFQFFAPQVNFPNPGDPLDNGLLSDDKVTYTARVSYDVTDSLNAYFTYSTGWKAGAVNLSSDSRPPDPATGFGRTANPEDVTLYEIGMKASFDGGYINVALFDQTIEGFQSNLFIGTGFVLANAEEQSVRGFEVDAAYNIVDPLLLTFSITYLDPEFDVFTQAPCTSFQGFAPAACVADPATGFSPNFFDGSGLTPAGIHEVSLSTSATYTHDFANGAQGFLRLDYLYESDVQALDNVPASIASREVSVLNGSIGYEMENGFSVSVWGRNLTDDEFLLSAFPSVGQADPRGDWFGGTLDSFSGYTNTPRTYGVTVRKSF